VPVCRESVEKDEGGKGGEFRGACAVFVEDVQEEEEAGEPFDTLGWHFGRGEGVRKGKE